MTEESHVEDDLGQFLARRARRATDGLLALLTGTGLMVCGAALIWRGRGWLVVVALALTISAFSGWGILDREIRERETGGSHLWLRGARAGAAVLGAVAALTVLFAAISLTLGTWIS